MYGRRTAGLFTTLALSATWLALLAPASPAASREPLRDALAVARHPARAFDSAVRPRPAALRAMVRQSAQRYAAASEFQISSDAYGPAEVESVAAVLRSLDHGPELAQLSVFVATPEEIRRTCGAAVVACYVPVEREMVVSGIDRAVAGVPRDFAIAHEYGHHVANSRQGGAFPAIEAGAIRWATYERVCQLTRRGRLFPGDQGAHYWEDPEEAFAQSFARLNRPGAHVSWHYTPLLRPTAASLAKVHADVARPWTGPVEATWSGAVAAAPADPGSTAGVRSGPVGIGGGHAVGDPSWVASRPVRTPLDGPVSISLQSQPGAALTLALRDSGSGHILSRAATGPSGGAALSYPNCGRASVRLEVRSTGGAARFRAAIARP